MGILSIPVQNLVNSCTKILGYKLTQWSEVVFQFLDFGVNVFVPSNVELTEIKTGKRKKFPINDKLKPLITEFTKDRDNDEPLFISKHGNRMERTQCYRILNNACKKAGIDYKIGTHTLRKTFGYHHYKKYKDVAILQKIFNHSSPLVTLIYIGINQDILDDSYKKFIL